MNRTDQLFQPRENTPRMFDTVEPVERQRGLSFPPPAPMPEKMDEKYRPRILSEVLGQSYSVEQLKRFAAAPYPNVFLLSGDTGIGKSTCALALANELGIHPEWGIEKIKAGKADGETVEKAFKNLSHYAMVGGWKMLVVDEADTMSHKAKMMFLSMLEDIPSRAVIVMTTNHPDKFDQPFLDRCAHLVFESRADVAYPDAQAYMARLWTAEKLPGTTPDVLETPGIVVDGAISYRRIAKHIERIKLAQPIEVVSVAPAHSVRQVDLGSVGLDPVAPRAARAVPDNVPSAGTDPNSIDWQAVLARSNNGESNKRLALSLGVSNGCVFNRLKSMRAHSQPSV